MMKTILGSVLLCLSMSAFAGSHGVFILNCTSDSLRTHLSLELNDYDFAEEALDPQRVVLSVMGNMSIFDDKREYGFGFKTIDRNGRLEIYSTDRDKSHVFSVDFSKRSSAQVVIKKAINPRNNKAFRGLVLQCTKRHEL